MRITALTPQRSGRWEVEIDGESAATLTGDALSALGLHVGDEVSESRRANVVDEGAAIATYDRAIRFLAARARSVVELRRRLVQAKAEPAHVERALARLVEQGLLNDSEYALQLARSKVQGQGISKRRFKQELFRRGVPTEAGDVAIGQLEEEGLIDEGAAIERLIAKKARSLAGQDPATRQRRLWGLLARRGYDSDAIRQAIKEFERSQNADA